VLERVTDALRGIDGLTGMSVMEIEGFGEGSFLPASEAKGKFTSLTVEEA